MPLSNPDKVFDDLLVMQYKAGDKKAMGLLMKRWNTRIVSYVLRNTKSIEAAKDISQEVWLVALDKIHYLSDSMKIGSWLLAIAHYKSIDWIRENEKSESTTTITADQELTPTDNSKELERMRAAMKTLSDEHRNILSLYYLEGFTLVEIAHIIQLSIGTVKSRLFYARESLKKKVKSNNHE